MHAASWSEPGGRRTRCSKKFILKLDGYVFDGRERAEDVNFLVRRVDINLQSCSLSAYPDVLVMIVNFHEFSIRILFEFFDDGMKDRHGFAAVLGGVPQLLVRNKMQGHGDGCGGNPHMNVRAASTVFVNVDAYHAIAHGVGACENECSANCESCFRE